MTLRLMIDNESFEVANGAYVSEEAVGNLLQRNYAEVRQVTTNDTMSEFTVTRMKLTMIDQKDTSFAPISGHPRTSIVGLPSGDTEITFLLKNNDILSLTHRGHTIIAEHLGE